MGRPEITTPIIIPRSEHIISRANISENALKVLYRLKKANFDAYLVGGAVRDLLLGLEPKDFDVATNARPEQIRELFKNCRLIGRRFRLAHVHFGKDIIEVATFRGQDTDEGDQDRTTTEEGRILSDNIFGSIEEDAWRRDFSVNALYYNIHNFTVVDYVGGMEDLNAGFLRLIGNADERYREDPVRMLRAVRFATKLGFRLHEDTELQMQVCKNLLSQISPSRLFDEVIKLFFSGVALQSFEALRHFRLFGQLFPQAEETLGHEQDGFPVMLIAKAMSNTDQRIADSKPVTPAFLYAAILWGAVQKNVVDLRSRERISEVQALQRVGSDVLRIQAKTTALPRRFSFPMREIWSLQPRFKFRKGNRALKLLAHPRFRAAYDFLLLRAECGEVEEEVAHWWTNIQTLSAAEQKALTSSKRSRKPTRTRKIKG